MTNKKEQISEEKLNSVFEEYIQPYVDKKLSEQRQSILEEVEKIKKPYCSNDYCDSNVVEALDTVISIIKCSS